MTYFRIVILTVSFFFMRSTLTLAQKRDKEPNKSAYEAKDNRPSVTKIIPPPAPPPPPAQSTGATTSNPPKKERKPKAEIPAQSTEEPASSPTKVVKTRKSKTATQDAAITEQEIRDIREQIRILIYRVDALEKQRKQN
jgi:outer membrane biosynthesis protein TonB